MSAYLYLLIAIFFEVIATSLLKVSDGFTRLWPTLGSLGGYIVAFYFLSLTLKDIPTGIAYAIWSGVGIVLIALLGLLLFKERLSATELLGMALIALGVIVMNISKGGAIAS